MSLTIASIPVIAVPGFKKKENSSLKDQLCRILCGSNPRLHGNMSYRVCTKCLSKANYRRWPQGCLGSARHSATRDGWLLDLPHLDGVRFTPKFDVVFIHWESRCLVFEHLTGALSKKSDLFLYLTTRHDSRDSQTHKTGNRHQNQMFSRLPYNGISSVFIFYSNLKMHMNSRVKISTFCILISR